MRVEFGHPRGGRSARGGDRVVVVAVEREAERRGGEWCMSRRRKGALNACRGDSERHVGVESDLGVRMKRDDLPLRRDRRCVDSDG